MVLKNTLFLYLIFSLTTAPLLAQSRISNPPSIEKQRKTLRAEILYRTKTADFDRAIQQYRIYRSQIGQDDLELLQQMATLILEQGAKCKEQEEQLLAIYGVGISENPKLLHILEAGLDSPTPVIQLVSLHFLSKMHDDRANQSIKRAMASPFVIIRLEAALRLVANRDSSAVGQVESLIYKVDPLIKSVFPQLFAMAGDGHSIAILKQLLTDSDPLVRLEVISNAAEHRCEALIPQLQALCSSPNVDEKEACASCLGVLKDENSAPLLEKLAKQTNESVKLAALLSLYQLGRLDSRVSIEKLAKNKNLFAIAALGEIPGSEETLASLLMINELQVYVNASMGLLLRRDPRCMPFLRAMILQNPRDLLLIPQESHGRSLKCWSVVPSAKQQFKDKEDQLKEAIVKTRSALLTYASNLPMNEFLCFADEIFQSKQQELIPIAIELIENLQNEGCNEFLKLQLKRAGNPLVRQCCNLALFRIGIEGPYKKNLIKWVKEQRHTELINFTPLKPLDKNNLQDSYTLTTSEASNLLLDSLIALANHKDAESIDALLHVLQTGNPQNRFLIAGLLLRAVE